MAKASDRAAWCRTFAVLAQMFNVNRGKNSEAIDPMQFYPWPETGSHGSTLPPPTEADRKELRQLFPGKGTP